MSATTHEVQLAIYDLSGGMARSLSSQFLGPNHAIDIIPHTAIVVYGLEYYFGMGIESCPPTEFRRTRQIHPIEIQSLGRTTLTQADFESWCRRVTSDGTYGPQAYDLLNKNCNNFSHDAAIQGLRLPRGVPDWILDVPRRFLSSPMGMMVRPILEGMQVTGHGGAGGNNAPFAGASGQYNQFGSPATATTNNNAVPAAPTPAVPSAADNPWANIAPKNVQEVENTATPKEITPEIPSEVQSDGNLSTPILDSHDRFLLSDDTAVVPICVSKLTKNKTDSEKALIERLGKVLSSPNEKTSDAVNTIAPSCEFLVNYINGDGAGSVAFALMLLRLVVLHSSCNEKMLSLSSYGVGTNLVNTDKAPNNNPLKGSAAARSMAWCVVSNAVSKCNGGDNGASLSAMFSATERGNNDDAVVTPESLIDAAIMDVSPENQPRVEVRQSASAFLYNIAHFLAMQQQQSQKEGDDDELPDVMVLLLCGSLEGIHDEVDGTVRLRRLLVAAKLLHSGSEKTNEMARSLAMDLGFCDIVEGLMTSNESAGDEKKAGLLAAEIHSILLLSAQS